MNAYKAAISQVWNAHIHYQDMLEARSARLQEPGLTQTDATRRTSLEQMWEANRLYMQGFEVMQSLS